MWNNVEVFYCYRASGVDSLERKRDLVPVLFLPTFVQARGGKCKLERAVQVSWGVKDCGTEDQTALYSSPLAVSAFIFPLPHLSSCRSQTGPTLKWVILASGLPLPALSPVHALLSALLSGLPLLHALLTASPCLWCCSQARPGLNSKSIYKYFRGAFIIVACTYGNSSVWLWPVP